jgi:hypothetical protein
MENRHRIYTTVAESARSTGPRRLADVGRDIDPDVVIGCSSRLCCGCDRRGGAGRLPRYRCVPGRRRTETVERSATGDPSAPIELRARMRSAISQAFRCDDGGAGRIVGAQRLLVADASHELRTAHEPDHQPRAARRTADDPSVPTARHGRAAEAESCAS